MNLKRDPTELATTLLNRSTCAVKVAAILLDKWGVFSWGWNSSGLSGMGEHAEAHCIRRANRNRIPGSIMYVAATRKRTGRVVTACPCLMCQKLIYKYGITVWYRNGYGGWWLL